MSDQTIAARFARDTEKHELTVLHDEGLYRHLRFKQPERGAYWFDLVTWPYNLVVTGDMGAFHFGRFGSDTEDMFALFRGHRINPDYWAEKLRAGRDDAQDYSEDVFRRVVAEQGADDRVLSALVKAEILDSDEIADEASARSLLDAFEHDGWRFSDTWEFNFRDFTAQYLWCCHAIVWGIGQYDAARQASLVPAATGGAL